MLDLTLLRILKHKEHYDRIVPGLPRGALDEKTMILLDDFGAYLDETKHPVVKMGPFKTYFFNFRHKKLPAEIAAYYSKLIDRLDKDVDEQTTRAMNNRLVELSFATDVGNTVHDYNSGKEVDVIHTIGAKHETARSALLRGDATELFVAEGIDELLDEDEDNTGLQFRLACLRNGLRPLRGGDFVIAAGRPDTGKTTFVLSEASNMALQLPKERPVIWFNNEGQGVRIVKRLYQAVLGCTLEDLQRKRKAGTLNSEYRAALGETDFRVIDIHDWTNVMVEDVCDQLNPGLVIFDMIDNIKFVGAGKDARTDQVLEAMYIWARNLGVKHDFPVIACSQVSAEAEQQTDTQCYPAQHMLKDSKTGKQGAADLMIMIGRSSDPTMPNARFVSTPKNKLATGTILIKQQVNFDGARARYSDPI